ncbi:MAG: Crp/Fnr family transcriptional regulator [Flavobacteriales bacterium]
MNLQPLINHYEQHIQLTEEEKELLKDYVTERTYLKGQFILQQGDVCTKGNFIVKGCTKMFLVDREGNEHIVMFGVEDWIVSDLGSFISQTPADYNIQCLETTTVLQFEKEKEEQMLKKIPKLQYFYSVKLQSALVHAHKRIVRNLSHTAKERYIYFRNRYPNIEQRIPQYMIASYLGISKEFFSKIKKEVVLGE